MAYREGAAFGRPTLRSSGPVARDARTRPLSDALGDSSTPPARFQHNLCLDAALVQHVDEHLGVEQIDAAPHQATDPGLGHAKELSGLGLLQATRRDHR